MKKGGGEKQGKGDQEEKVVKKVFSGRLGQKEAEDRK